MWPLSWMMVMAVSSSSRNVAALTPRSGGVGGSLSLCFSLAMGFVRGLEGLGVYCEQRMPDRMMQPSRFETQVSNMTSKTSRPPVHTGRTPGRYGDKVDALGQLELGWTRPRGHDLAGRAGGHAAGRAR